METATPIGADAPAPFALEMTAPADTPAYLSTHDAAAVLRKLRQPKMNETDTTDSARAAAAAPEPGKESAADPADDAKAAELQKKALVVLSDLGFDEAELVPLWNGQKELSLRDHRLQLLIRDATLWREAQTKAKAKAAAVKPVPPVQRPGAATPRQGTDEARVQHLTQRLEQSGSLRDAAALVRARRAAAR